MKKHVIFAGSLFALSLATFGQIQATVTDAQINNLEHRVNALEQKKGANAMVNPSGRPQVRDGIDLFYTVDLLVWQSHENGLGYTTKGSADQPLSSALYNTETKNMHFDWDPGFRVGFGWNTPHDGWDLSLNWTWFQNTASRNKTAASGEIYLATDLFSPATTSSSGFYSANTKWRLHLNMLDLELGREFFVSKWMTLRPFISLRNTWVYQKNKETFTGAIPAANPTGALLTNSCNFWGIGPRSGLNTEWGLGSGISLFGDADFSLLYGFFSRGNLQKQNFVDGTSNTVVNNKDSVRVSRAIAELALGLRWDSMMGQDYYHIRIQAGWEHLMLFGQNQFKTFTGVDANNTGAFISNQGDLTIQGWTLSARFDF